MKCPHCDQAIYLEGCPRDDMPFLNFHCPACEKRFHLSGGKLVKGHTHKGTLVVFPTTELALESLLDRCNRDEVTKAQAFVWLMQYKQLCLRISRGAGSYLEKMAQVQDRRDLLAAKLRTLLDGVTGQ